MKGKWIAFGMALVLLSAQSVLGIGETVDQQETQELTIQESELVDRNQNQYDEAVLCYDEGDYEQAFKMLFELAQTGDVTAMSWIGYLYEQGLGVDRDVVAATGWFKKAAEQGDGYSMSYLSKISYKDEKFEESIYWAEQARDIGYLDAEVCETIGKMYFLGDDIDQDYDEAKEWLTLAAERGRPEAIHRLGEIYQIHSENVPDHDQLAIEWYERGVALGDAACKYHLADYLQRDPNATIGMLTRSYDLFHEAIDAGNANAMLRYGTLLLQGYMGKTEHPEEVTEEVKEVFALFEASDIATPDRIASIGDAWKNALPEVANLEEASRYYEMAAEQGSTYALEQLAQLASKSEDYETAYAYLIKAEQNGSESSYVYDMLGWLYASGHVGSEPDYDLAAQYYERSVELGSGYALYQIGTMYLQGQHYEADEEMAQEYYRLAEEAGYTEE